MTEFDSSAWSGMKHLALLIGIDDYRGVNVSPLKGCVNDVENLQSILTGKFGFAVVSLKDQAASRDAVLAAMQRLLDWAESDSQIVFAWSGHGSTLPLSRDRTFETLVPCDSSRNGIWETNRDITDRELFGWVCQVSDKTPFLTLIIDACKSGGIVRDLLPRPRGISGETPKGGFFHTTKNAFLPDEAQVLPKGGGGWLPVSDRYTLLAGCRFDEYCREFKDPETGLQRGLFSYHLQRALTDQREGRTWRSLFANVADLVNGHNKSQHPQLEGQLDRLVFGREVLRPAPFLSVVARQDRQLTLSGGAAHGVTPGSIFALASPDSVGPDPGATLGELVTEMVGAVQSLARLQAENHPGCVEKGCRAFEVSRPLDTRFRILLAPSVGADPELRKLIGDSAFLNIAEDDLGEGAELVLHRLPARGATCGEGEPLPQVVNLRVPSWGFQGPDGCQLASPLPANGAGNRGQVVKTLETLARHRFLESLEHPDQTIAASRTVELTAYRLRETDRGQVISKEKLGEKPILDSGTRIAFEVEHCHHHPLQVTLISLGLAGTIDIVFPGRGKFEPLAPGKILEIGLAEVDALEIGAPSHYPFAGDPPFAGSDEALLFLFTENVASELDLIQQDSVRTGRLPAGTASSSRIRRATPAERALRIARSGLVHRNEPLPDELEGPGSWGLIRWRFFLRP